jgi:hypothetical protein
MFFFMSLLLYVLVFNLTSFYMDDFNLSSNKLIRLMQTLSPLFILILFYLLYYEVVLHLEKGSISFGGVMDYQIGLIICLANGSAIAFNLSSNYNLPPMYIVLVQLIGGIIGGSVYFFMIQFL